MPKKQDTNRLRVLLEKKLKKQRKGRVMGLTLQDLPSPDKLLHCEAMAKAIVDRLMNGESLEIIGDYDVDGIMATVILMSVLLELGFSEEQVAYHIPSRLKDGYGVSPNVVEYVKDKGSDFILTCDNGIAAVEAVALANSYNIPVYISDHHTAPETLPAAEMIVNPKQKGETFPFVDISGATVAWYLGIAMHKYFREKYDKNMIIDMRKYLDYCAITVISDVMPLDHINLAILDYGMRKIKSQFDETKKVQGRHIYNCVWNDWTAPVINTKSISFGLVPMINASGRIDDANTAVRMFLSKNKTEITQLYKELVEVNEVRKNMNLVYKKQAKEIIQKLDIADDPVIIIRNDDFHEGLIGIIAGKVAEEYKKPAFVFAYNEEKGILKASVRTYGNIHLYNLIHNALPALLGFGGHKGAAGLSMKPENMELFKELIFKAARKLPPEDFIDDNLIPIPCELGELEGVFDILNEYGPFGQANPEPIFETTVSMKRVDREMKGGLHYKLDIEDGTAQYTSLFFYVEKEEFLETIKSDFKINYYPGLSFNPRKNIFTSELFCNVVE